MFEVVTLVGQYTHNTKPLEDIQQDKDEFADATVGYASWSCGNR
jgi:hypothetical protein